MNSIDAIDQQKNISTTAESNSPFVPITPKSSEIITFKEPLRTTKPLATKTMLQEAIKYLAAKSRKAFSLASIRKYISDNYLHTPNEIKHRLPYMKKFFKTALESGDIIHVKGNGLNGSFRVPKTSPMHKNAKKNVRKERKLKRKPVKKVMKPSKVKLGPVLKAKKVKRVNRRFSANI